MEINDIIEAIRSGRINISSHARKEAKEDSLVLTEIIFSTCHGEIIEDYPKEKIMTYVEKCPHCGGQVIEKDVIEVLHGGFNTAFLTVKAGVCLHCGERLYTPETVRQFEEIEAKLAHQETAGFQAVGQSFQVVA